MKLVLILVLLVIILILNIVKLYITYNVEYFSSSMVGTKWKLQNVQKMESFIIKMNASLHFISKDKVNFDLVSTSAMSNNPKKILAEQKESKKGTYLFNPKTKIGQIMNMDNKNEKTDFRLNKKGELEILSSLSGKVEMTLKKI